MENHQQAAARAAALGRHIAVADVREHRVDARRKQCALVERESLAATVRRRRGIDVDRAEQRRHRGCGSVGSTATEPRASALRAVRAGVPRRQHVARRIVDDEAHRQRWIERAVHRGRRFADHCRHRRVAAPVPDEYPVARERAQRRERPRGRPFAHPRGKRRHNGRPALGRHARRQCDGQVAARAAVGAAGEQRRAADRLAEREVHLGRHVGARRQPGDAHARGIDRKTRQRVGGRLAGAPGQRDQRERRGRGAGR